MTTVPRPQVVPARPRTRWQVLPPAPPAEVDALMGELGLPPLLAAMLWNRGFRVATSGDLRPALKPAQISNIEEAAARLDEAVKSKRRILIHGDYDADGITGTALLLLGLRSLGAKADAFIPNRLDDGYGIHPARVEEHARRCDLLITVDCGISNLAELEGLQGLGIEAIVTDHHEPGEQLPNCLCVHPRLETGPGEDAELTGAGVAFHLLWRLHELRGLEPPFEYADLAAIGTIADVAPLTGANRALVREGLSRMGDSERPGIKSAILQAGLKREIAARDVAFVLAPRLNAAGRLGEADKGLELLTTGSKRKALELASYLEARNVDRRKIQDEMFEEALLRVDEDAPALVLANDGWHPGVMGIVAAKLLERFYKPVYIIARGKGSVRSTPGISAVKALRAAQQHLLGFGGHERAAGFGIDEEQIPAFREAIYRFVEAHPTPAPSMTADALLTTADIDTGLLRAMEELEPFGEGHPAPVFVLSDRLEGARAVGSNSATLQLRIAGMRGVAWQKGELASVLRSGERVDAAVSIQEREWRGKRRLEFVADEIRPHEALELPEAVGPEVCLSIARGPAPHGEPVKASQELEPGRQTYWLRSLRLSSDPLQATLPLRELLASGATVYLDLDEGALGEARGAADLLPSLDEVRKGFVYLQRQTALPFPPAKRELIERILRDLELIDEQGRVRRGEKRDPYTSSTLRVALLEKYRITSLLGAYRSCNDISFRRAASILLAGPSCNTDA